MLKIVSAGAILGGAFGLLTMFLLPFPASLEVGAVGAFFIGLLVGVVGGSYV